MTRNKGIASFLATTTYKEVASFLAMTAKARRHVMPPMKERELISHLFPLLVFFPLLPVTNSPQISLSVGLGAMALPRLKLKSFAELYSK
jgi:hypothetical protein